MSEEYDFNTELLGSIRKADKEDQLDVLKMIFKSYVAKLIEIMMEQSGNANAIEAGILVEVKSNLIHEFRNAELEELQRSEEMYESMFDEALGEILNLAALSHQGEDSIKFANRVMDINPDAYVNEGGLYVPDGMRR